MNKIKEFPDCSHTRSDCAACHGGRCVALEDTDFGDKPCPFYMDIQTKTQRIKECSERLAALGARKRCVS